MNNLPEEFYEWLQYNFETNEIVLRPVKWDSLPQTCQIALVVEWLEMERGIYLDSESLEGNNKVVFGWRLTCVELLHEESYGGAFDSRNQALIAGITKALEI